MRINRIAKWLAAAGALSYLCACVNESSLHDFSPVSLETDSQLETVTVELGREGYADIKTRSSFTWSDTDIKDVELVVTDESGNVKDVLYSTTSTTLSFTGTVGHTYNVWAAANIGGKINVTTLSDFTSGSRSVSYSDIASKGIPMYSVNASGQPGPASVTVAAGGSNVTVNVKRMMAKVNFKIDKSYLANPSAFEVKGVKIYNAINSYAPFTANVKQAHSGSIDYSFDKASASDVTAINSGSAIDLYAFENMQGTLLSGNTDPWKKVPAQISGSADYCTYLEMEASYASGGKTYGKVTYRMYLGDDATTNFDVKRNTKYAITLFPTEDEVDGHRGSWKVETTDWDDERSLAFSPKSVTIECLTSGSTSIVKSPTDLAYEFTYSAADAAAAGLTITKTGDSVSIVSTTEVTSNKTVTLHIETADGLHSDDCVITVTPKAAVEGKDYEIVASADPESIKVGGTTAFSATLYEYKTVNGVRTGTPTPVSGATFTWTSRTTGILTVSGSTGTGVSAGTAKVYASCSYGGNTYTSDDVTVIVGNDVQHVLEITPASKTIAEGQTAEFTAIYYTVTNGTKDAGTDVTSLSATTWSVVSGSTYVDMTGKGEFAWKAGDGEATVKASYNGTEATAKVYTGSHVPVVTYELVITPATSTLNEGEDVQLTATYYTITDGVRDGGQDVTSSATWTVTEGGSYIDETSTKGKYSWKSGAGSATVKASYGTGSAKAEGSATINTTEHETVVTYELVLTPSDQLIYENGSPASITAMYYTLNDGVRVGGGQNVTNSVSWSVPSGGSYISYASKGHYNWKSGPGTATVKATYNGLSATATVRTAAHEPEVTYEMKITPVDPVIEVGESLQLHVEEWKYEDGVQVDHWDDIHSVCTWTRGNTRVILGSDGLITGQSVGEVTVTASYYEYGYGNVSDYVTVTVIEPTAPEPTLEYIELVMDPDVIEIGEKSYGTVIAHYSDNSTEDVTDDCTWSSNAPGGTFTGTTPGTFTVKATYGGMSDTDDVTVVNSIDYIELVMDPHEIAVDEESEGTVTVYYKDGSHEVVSNSACSWTITSGGSCGSLSNRGVFTGESEGTATIKATYQGYYDTDTVTVNEYDIHVD